MFVKSSYSNSFANCVEVERRPGAVAVRDSKDPGGAVLLFTHAQWGRFMAGIKDGESDRPLPCPKCYGVGARDCPRCGGSGLK